MNEDQRLKEFADFNLKKVSASAALSMKTTSTRLFMRMKRPCILLWCDDLAAYNAGTVVCNA